MTDLAEKLSFPGYKPKDGKFVPVARYYAPMDFLLYLNKDCSYRADRVDAFLTVLWHPDTDDLVGIKLKGFRFLFQQLKAISDIPDDVFLPMIKFLEVALVGGVAESMMEKIEGRRLRDKYEAAKQFARAEDLQVAPEEYLKAA